MARRFGLPIVWGTDPKLDGRSLSVARDANIPAIYVEYLGGGGCDSHCVSAYVQGCRSVLIDLGLIDGELPCLPSDQLVIEDERPDAGHMQIHHPAPRNGLFEAAVTLGQSVRRGDILGTVSDVRCRDTVPVTADRAGVVLVLRSFARVLEGDCLGVILETDQLPPPF
jgi:predicted deacylase